MVRSSEMRESQLIGLNLVMRRRGQWQETELAFVAFGLGGRHSRSRLVPAYQIERYHH